MASPQLSEVEQIENLIGKYKELQRRVQELDDKSATLEEELSTAKTELKKLEVFRPLLEDQTKYWVLRVEDRGVCQQLMGRALQVFGRAADANASGQTARLYARQKINFIVTACVRYGVGPGWLDVFSRYIKDANRIPPDEK